jgi:arginyl-tRNA synthetase
VQQLAAEAPPRPELGDLAFPVSSSSQTDQTATARNKRHAPSPKSSKPTRRHRRSLARRNRGAGYINVFFDRAKLLSLFAGPTSTQAQISIDRRRWSSTPASIQTKPRTSVTSATPSWRHVRAHPESRGDRVEVQNYIDNTGVQVADVVVGFLHSRRWISTRSKRSTRRSQRLSVRLLLLGSLHQSRSLLSRRKLSGELNPEKTKLRNEVLHALEEGGNPIAELADYVATRNVECILDTMERLGIRYDLLARESDILHLHFWERAFELMKKAGRDPQRRGRPSRWLLG